MSPVLAGWLLAIAIAALLVGLASLFVGRRKQSSPATVDSLFAAGLSTVVLLIGFVILAMAPHAGLSRGTSFVVVGGGLMALSLVITLVRIAYVLGTQR